MPLLESPARMPVPDQTEPLLIGGKPLFGDGPVPVSYTHLRVHET